MHSPFCPNLVEISACVPLALKKDSPKHFLFQDFELSNVYTKGQKCQNSLIIYIASVQARTWCVKTPFLKKKSSLWLFQKTLMFDVWTMLSTYSCSCVRINIINWSIKTWNGIIVTRWRRDWFYWFGCWWFVITERWTNANIKYIGYICGIVVWYINGPNIIFFGWIKLILCWGTGIILKQK